MATPNLFELKEWLTVPEAATHLARLFDEKVTEADVLRLALDGKLQLSIYFVNYTKAQYGKVVGIDGVEWGQFTPEQAASFPNLPEEAKGKPLPYIRSLSIDGERYLSLSDEITTLKGVWDLPMIGNEKVDVEHRYQSLTNGPEVTLQGLDGAFVSRGADVICQLQEDFDDNQYQPGSTAARELLEQRISIQDIGQEEAKKLRQIFKEERKNYLEIRKNQPEKDNYYPAGGLPSDGVLVVRVEALKEFERSLLNASEKELSTRERDTLYKIIIGMAVMAYRHDPAAKRSETIADIVRDLERVGVAVSDDTVRKHIKEASQLLPRKPA